MTAGLINGCQDSVSLLNVFDKQDGLHWAALVLKTEIDAPLACCLARNSLACSRPLILERGPEAFGANRVLLVVEVGPGGQDLFRMCLELLVCYQRRWSISVSMLEFRRAEGTGPWGLLLSMAYCFGRLRGTNRWSFLFAGTDFG